jgi:hypothetical protein
MKWTTRKRILREKIKKAAESTEVPKKQKLIQRTKPLTSEYELKKTRKEINAINRRRAKNMERDVAYYLKGKRVPSSGAIAGMKGDCTIPLESGGFYIVECKMSANQDKSGNSCIILSLEWFNKVVKDARSMSAKFGVLVIHYFGKKQDYVFVSSSTLRYMAAKSIHEPAINKIIDVVKPIDISTVSGRMRSVYKLVEKDLLSAFIPVWGFSCAAYNMSSGVWYVFTLEQYRDLLEGV